MKKEVLIDAKKLMKVLLKAGIEFTDKQLRTLCEGLELDCEDMYGKRVKQMNSYKIAAIEIKNRKIKLINLNNAQVYWLEDLGNNIELNQFKVGDLVLIKGNKIIKKV